MTKTSRVSTRVLPEEKNALVQIAHQERRGVSEALRELIRDEAQRRGLWPPATLRESKKIVEVQR